MASRRFLVSKLMWTSAEGSCRPTMGPGCAQTQAGCATTGPGRAQTHPGHAQTGPGRAQMGPKS